MQPLLFSFMKVYKHNARSAGGCEANKRFDRSHSNHKVGVSVSPASPAKSMQLFVLLVVSLPLEISPQHMPFLLVLLSPAHIP
jgi:hypothetical protein